MNSLLRLSLAALLITCSQPDQNREPNPYPNIGAIPVPAGYRRIPATAPSFAAWLRAIPLKRDRTVYLFNGQPKRNQDAQFAVLDISVGHQDLQQCADAVMRLRAEYLYSIHDYAGIDFCSDAGNRYNFLHWTKDRPAATRAVFDHFLNTVFTYCGTHSLERQLVPVSPIGAIAPGDVLIKGGYPGHAMLVVDVAEDAAGRRIYLLAQSYMPAQDIHIVKNPANPANFVGASFLVPPRSFPSLSLANPWYRADSAGSVIETPEWTFTINQLRSWPKKP